MMPDWFTFPPAIATFAMASFMIELTPGPNMGYLAVVALGKGKKAGYAVVAGVALGLLVLGLAGAWGASEILRTNQMAYEFLRLGGIVYLFYLAWEGWRGEKPERETIGGNYLRGFMNNVLNPKAALFYIAVLPEFANSAKPLMPQIIVLTLVYVLIATIIHASVVAGAGSFHRFVSDPNRERLVRRGMSLSLAIFALWFAWSTAR